MIGVCVLCGKTDELLDSHFLPAALYRELNDPGGPIQQMIVITPDGTYQSGDQFSMPLLCQECEIRFQQGGEYWTLTHRWRPDGTYPLRDMLLATAPESSNANVKVYNARSVKGLEPEKLLYFAASIFWRAGIADWKTRFVNAPKIDLPIELMEKLKQFLLGSGPFPKELFILITVVSDARPLPTLISPKKAQDTPFVRYEMHITAMMFEFFLNAEEKYDVWSISNAPERIVLSDMPTQRLRQIAATNVPNSEPKGSLAKKLSSMGL
jgi:hypothetical protein